jgi:transcriptional regulator with XRE-family HTH domain
MTSALKMIWKKMSRKAYRDSFVSAHISNLVASQIATLRAKHNWTQKQLAEKSGMRQSRISALEDPNYENIEVSTLRRLASAFDVALTVRFVPFSELARWTTSVTNNQVSVASFADDAVGAPITTGLPLPPYVTPQQPDASTTNEAPLGRLGNESVYITTLQ